MKDEKLNFTTIGAILLTLLLIAVAVALGGNAASFADMPAFLIVVCGTTLVIIASYSFKDIGDTFSLLFYTTAREASNPVEVAEDILTLCSLNRKAGNILELQGDVKRIDNDMLRRAAQMLVDGVDSATTEAMIRQESISRMERRKRAVSLLRRGADVAPAMGLIGTLIGLVQMLGNLDDPSSIGPAMAVALLTTLYGAIIAYILLSPLATKLERNSIEEALSNAICARGVMIIDKRENPSQAAMMLNTILPPERHIPEVRIDGGLSEKPATKKTTRTRRTSKRQL